MARYRPAPPVGSTIEELEEWLAEQGLSVRDWPTPTPEQIERLRVLLCYDTTPPLAVGPQARRAS